MSRYLKNLDIEGRKKLAKRAGVSADYLYQIAYGYARPSPPLAKRLEKLTEGRVTAWVLRPDVFGGPLAGPTK